MDNARVGSLCVETFAKISASISHEIKNTLSIINENAGLLEDLAAMCDDETGVSPERIRAATGSISRQIERSNQIMKNLNRFAHSGDAPVALVNLAETIQLVVNLAARQAAMKKLAIKVSCAAELTCRTRAFIFEVLLYRALQRLFSAAEEGNELLIDVRGSASAITVSARASKHQNADLAPADDHDEQLLAAHISSTCRFGESSFLLQLPGDIEAIR